MINDGNAFPAPPGLIAGIKVGANDGTNDNIGVNHSEMGNSLKVRNAIKSILDGSMELKIPTNQRNTYRDKFLIQTK